MASTFLKSLLDLIPIDSSRISNPVDYQFSIAVVGHGGVGKSSLLDSFASNGKFYTQRKEKTKTCSNIVKIGNDKTAKLWVSTDAADFDGDSPREITEFDGIICVYDCNDATSYSNVKDWIRGINRVAPGVPKILVGNKCDSRSDLERVDAKTAQNLARENQMQFLETSAKNSMNVKQAFTAIAAEIRKKLCSQTKEVKLTTEGLVA